MQWLQGSDICESFVDFLFFLLWAKTRESFSYSVLIHSHNLIQELFKIYKELKQQNEIIFEAEKERNVWELERDELKGLAGFIKKGELQSKIDRKNEEIDILRIGLSGIVRRYGYQNVQEFNRTFHKSYNTYD